MALAGLALTVGLAGSAFKKLNTSLEKVTESLGGLAPRVAVARAEREVAIIQAQLARGQRVGAELAEFTSAGTDFRVALKESIDRLIEIFAPLATEVLETLTRIFKVVNAGFDFWDKFRETGERLFGPLFDLLEKFNVDDFLPQLKLLIFLLRKKEEENDEDGLDDIFGEINAFLRGDEARRLAGRFGSDPAGRPGAVFGE